MLKYVGLGALFLLFLVWRILQAIGRPFSNLFVGGLFTETLEHGNRLGEVDEEIWQNEHRRDAEKWQQRGKEGESS